MASWLEDLEDDWVSDGQLPSRPHPSVRVPSPDRNAENAKQKPSPQKSLIPRLASRKPAAIPKHISENCLKSHEVPDPHPHLETSSMPTSDIQEAGPDLSPQGTVQKLSTNQRPVILIDRGNEDLFSPTRLESLFEPLSNGSQSTHVSSISHPHNLEEDAAEDGFDSSRDGGNNTQSTQSLLPDRDCLNAFLNHSVADRSSVLRYESDGSLERSAWNSTPPPFIPWRATESSSNPDTSLYQGTESSAVEKNEEYINSISTSAFSDQSPGLNELLNVTSRSEFSKHIYPSSDALDSRQLAFGHSFMSQNDNLYYTTPDRKTLGLQNLEDASLELPDIMGKGWPPLKLFSSDRNAAAKATVYDRMSGIDLINSPHYQTSISDQSAHLEPSPMNRPKRLLDGTPASRPRKPAEEYSEESIRSDSFQPASPVKESQPKRQKMSLQVSGTLKGDKKVLRHPSGRVAPLTGLSESQESTSKLLIEPEIDFSRSPHASFLSDPHSAFTHAASLHSLNVILASKVKHMMPRKVGSMVFDEELKVWRHEDDVMVSARDDLLADLVAKDNSPPSAKAADPFEEISDLATSFNSRLLLSRDEKEEETNPSGVGSSDCRTVGQEEICNESEDTVPHILENAESSGSALISNTHASLSHENKSQNEITTYKNTTASLKSGLRPISPNVDPKKSGREDMFHMGKRTLRSHHPTNVNEEENIGMDESTIENANSDATTPISSTTLVKGTYPKDPKTQKTPCQTLRQYTLQLQTSGRPVNGALLSMRKSDSSFWNTPLTDITYHFLEGDSRMHSGYSRGFYGRNSRQVRKFAHDRTSLALKSMVRHLTDNDMFGPYWDQNKALQIQKQGLEHLQDLASFHPNLIEVNLENNQLTHLTGMPPTVRDLKVSGNLLSSLTAWTHLTNIQFLDISSNRLDNLSGLSNLIHLRDLKADDNQITTLEGIMYLDGLVKLRLRYNRIGLADFNSSNLKHLKILDLARNKIERVENLHRLPELSYLNLDSNNLVALEMPDSQELQCLRTLDISRNNLDHFSVTPFPNLKTLYLDSNKLGTVDGITHVRYLDSFSFRSQVGSSAVDIPFTSLYELRKVYSSGNPISSFSLNDYFANLQYLELASCNIRSLPTNLGRLMSNIRVLNLNNNAISDIKPLYGIIRLKKLFLMGNRVSNLQKFSNTLKYLPLISELDLRHNPLTLGFYGVLSQSTDLTTGSEKPEGNTDPSPFLMHYQDQDSDEKFQRSMTEDTAVARRCYEILIGEKCPQMLCLDGLGFNIQHKMRQDKIWERMTSLGLLYESLPVEDDRNSLEG